jgi:mannosyltransferase OCH1-like enzyme
MLKTNNKKNNYYKNMIIQEINKKKFRDQKKKEKIENEEKIENDFKTFYNRTFESIIPFKIYQAWHSDDIPDSVIYCIDNIKKSNPEFEHFLFNNNKCREFIKENFSKETLDAYDSIIPNAIKIDLWRYCILYMNGGIYLDVKYFCINNFKFKYLTDNEYFCRDIAESGSGIYNALIICKPKNEIMLKCINQVLENVKNNFYGDYSLEPTGPLMIKNFFSNDEVNNLNLSLNAVKNNILYIIYNNLPILYFNKNYRKEQIKYQKHWAEFWNDRNFYIKKTDETHSEVFTKIYETSLHKRQLI